MAERDLFFPAGHCPGVGLGGYLPQALATHCAEEYANLGSLLPKLYGRFGSSAS